MALPKNVGKIDKFVRLGLVIALALLISFDVVEGTLGIVLLVIAILLLVTSFINFCPLYSLIGVNTCKTKEK